MQTPSKRPKILSRLQEHNAELVCLTEAHPEVLSKSGHTICSDVIDGHDPLKCRKVLLWSAKLWRDADHLGSDLLPPGRFVSGVTQTSIGDLLIIGVCIPYGGARTKQPYKLKKWQNHEEYLLELKPLLAKLIKSGKPFIIAGDFNQCIDTDRDKSGKLQNLLKSTLDSLEIPTAYPEFHLEDNASIDHIGLYGLKTSTCRPIEDDHSNRLCGTDSPGHFGVVAGY